MKYALPLLFALFAPAVAQGQSYPEPVTTYVVRRGDTCRRIAQQTWRSADRVDLVHRYNRLGVSLPHALVPGTRLVLPRAAGARETDARVTRVEGTVTRLRPRPSSEQSARPQMDLHRGDRLSTRERSSAHVTFRDQTYLRLQESSTVVIYGPTQARAQALEVAPARVQLQRGTLEAGLLSLARARDLTVTTPNRETVTLRSSEAGVAFTPPSRPARGTLGRTSRGSTTVSVYRGTAQARAGGRVIAVREGTAVTLAPGRPPSAVRLLLPAPTWDAPTGDVLALRGAAPSELRWSELRGAVRWRVDVARDDLFLDMVSSVPLGVELRSWRAESLAVGRYWVRVRGVDAEQFVGMPSTPRVLQLLALDTADAELTPEGNVRVRRGAEGQPERIGFVGTEGVLVDGAPYSGPVEARDGAVTLTLAPRSGSDSPPQLRVGVTTVDAVAELRGPSEPVAFEAREARVSVSLRLPDGRPYAGPAPRAQATGALPVELRPGEPGTYDLVLRLPEGTRPPTVDVTVTAAWGAPLGSVTVRLAPPPEAPPPPVVPATPAAPAPPDRRWAVGARFWGWYTPPGLVGLFTREVGGAWDGALSFTPGSEYTFTAGPEITLRRGPMDVVLGLQYTGFMAEAGWFHGISEGDTATERIESRLWMVYANVLFLWRARMASWLEFQYGAGVGIGYVGGTLSRRQVHPSGGGYQDCTGPGAPDTTYCDTANNHYGSYTEPYLTDSPAGSLPPVIPWISLPHLALHARPHRRFDLRLDVGFALVGFYSGVAMHVVFD